MNNKRIPFEIVGRKYSLQFNGDEEAIVGLLQLGIPEDFGDDLLPNMRRLVLGTWLSMDILREFLQADINDYEALKAAGSQEEMIWEASPHEVLQSKEVAATITRLVRSEVSKLICMLRTLQKLEIVADQHLQLYAAAAHEGRNGHGSTNC